MSLEIPCNLFQLNQTEYVYQTVSIENNKYINTIYRSSISGGNHIERLDTGNLAAVSEQYEMIAYWQDNLLKIMDLRTSKTDILGSFIRPGKVSFCPAARQLVFTAAAEFPMEPEDVPELEAVQWIDRIKFKSDAMGIYDGRYEQVFVADIDQNSVRRITAKKVDYDNPAFLDRNTVICTAVPQNADVSDDTYFQIINLETKEERWVAGAGGPISELAVCPDGGYVAVLTHDNTYWEATNYKLYQFYPETEKIECLSDGLDRSVGNYIINDLGLKTSGGVIRFSEDGKKIYANITDGFITNLYEFSEGNVKKITNRSCVIAEYAIMGTGILMITSEVNNPASILYYHDGSYQILRQQENVFCDAAIEEFTYPGHNGEAFTGYLFYPEKKPLNGIVLDIHGGPHYCYGLGYSIDVHLMTEAGYAVVYSNPAGSQGNGEMIARASYHDWGGKDYQDLTSCVQRVMQLPRFSGLKLAVKGGSYGGYMVNWMIGHTDIFTCAISERSTCNRYSQAGTSDCAFRYGKFEFEDFPWEHCDSYMEHSPITYVKNVKTPVLLIHGDYDMNCPISQSEEWYSALKLENKEVYFARFKGQNHGFAVKGDPVCRKERYQLLLWWLNRYMKKYVYLQEYIHPKARALLEDKVNIIDNIDEIGKADAIISRNQFKVTKEVLDKAENLKVIGVHGTGMDNIDAEAARQKGVEIFNTPGINARSVAELNVLLALSLLRKTSQAADDIKAGKDMSNAKQDYQGNELTGKKVGFIGYGNIARHTADILKNGFSAKVYAWSRSLTPTKAEEENVIYCSGAEEVMSCADIIFLGLKLTEENQYIIHIDNLKKCKPSAILINTARGKLVKEEDLYRALTQHIIAGAASDVFEKEPVSSENILVPLSNFIPTPHLGANTEEALYRVGMAVVTGVLDRLSVTVTEEEMERYQL